MKVTGFELSLKWASQLVSLLSFWAGMACYAVSIVIWLYVLSRLQVSLAYPFQAAGYILSSVIAYLFLGEVVKPINMLGLVLIFFGLLCLSLGITKDG